MKVGCSIVAIALLAFSCAEKVKQENTAVLPIEQDSLVSAFVQTVPLLPFTISLQRLDTLLSRVRTDSVLFCRTINSLQKSLGDPNSPYRQEALYIKLLEEKLQSSWYNIQAKESAQVELHLRRQNAIGAPANDFAFIAAGNQKGRLYQLRSPFLLLYFNNPECNACQEMRTALIESPIIQSSLNSGQLKIVSVYIDMDEALWRKHLSEVPATWINVRDEDEYLYKNKVYDLRAIPSLYLLDDHKKVLIKDCMDIREIEKKLTPS